MVMSAVPPPMVDALRRRMSGTLYGRVAPDAPERVPTGNSLLHKESVADHN